MSHSKRQLASRGVCFMPKLFVCRMLNRAASFLDPVPTIFCHATMAATSYVGQADKDVAGVRRTAAPTARAYAGTTIGDYYQSDIPQSSQYESS